MGETAIAILLCNLLNGGVTEVRHYFPNLGEDRHVRVDCETPTHVIEIGMDNTASNRDSVHQALFSAYLTGKKPMVILIDAAEGRYEYEMQVVAGLAKVPFGVCKKHFIESWAASAGFRAFPDAATVGDLPKGGVAARHCDLAGQFDVPSTDDLQSALPSGETPLSEAVITPVSLSN